MTGGPIPVRVIAGRDRYRLKDFSFADVEYFLLHNLLAMRSAEAFATAMCSDRAAILLQPALRAGGVSLLRFEEIQALLSADGVHRQVGVQCIFGALSRS